MPPKGKDVKAKQIWKTSALIKDVVPSYCKNAPREPRPLKQPDNTLGIVRQPEFEPLPEPEEWPGDEAIKIDITTVEPFKDQFDWTAVYGDEFFVLRRPQAYLREEYEVEDLADAPVFKKSVLQNPFEFLFNKEDKYSTVFETPEKIQFMSNLLNDQICICESFERDETPEEIERRKKEQIEKITQQQAKDKKKPAKKPEELVEEGPLKIRDVRLSDVQVSADLSADSRWIGSQLQVIKDRDVRDVNSGRALWSKIYPQQDGAPIYNPNGRYKVKLYHMGKERKIEVDDRVPCHGNKCLLPQSTSPNQLWPIIMTKAILKLLQYQRVKNPKKQLVGDGFVMYSLMGLISETISLKNISTADWAVVSEMLNDQHYNKKDVFLTAFTQADTIPVTASNTQKKKSKEYINEMIKNVNNGKENFEPEEFNFNPIAYNAENGTESALQSSVNSPNNRFFDQQQMQQDQVQGDDSNTMVIRPIEFAFEKFKRRRSETDMVFPDAEDTKVIPGYAYSIVEQFQNRQFNMVYVQKRSDREMRLRMEYYDISKANIHKMQKDEKLTHRNRKKDIRAKLNDEDKRRIELITQAAIQHRVLRIKTGNTGSPQPTVYCQFSSEELYIAKKCITNKIQKPPNYDVPEIRGDDKSMASQTIKNMNQDETFTVKPLDDFSAIPNIQEPFKRDGLGFWLVEKDFLQLFENLQLCYDPKKLNQSQVVNVPFNLDNEIATYDNMEILVVQRNPEQDESTAVQLLMGFQAKYPQNADIEESLKPFTVLQRFDLEQFESVKDFKVLDSYLSGQLILLDNKNNIFRIQTFSPLQYTLWLSSTNTMQMCSVFEYLSEYEGYIAKSFSIDYPPIATKKYFVFFRFKIQILESSHDSVSFVFRVKSTTDNNMLKGMRLKLCEVPVEPTYMLTTIEGVHKNLYETIYVVQGTQRIPIRNNTQYYFILEGTTSYAIQEGALEVDFLTNSDSQIQIEQLDSVEPVDLIDKYVPTKYGIIFREKLFVNDITMSSIFVRLGEVLKQEVAQLDKKAPPVKGKTIEQPDIVDTELKEQKLIKLELFHNDNLIMYTYGFNQAILSNVPLKSTKDESQAYILQASFDLREWPESTQTSQDTEFINWFLTIFSTDTLAVVRDTTKEDREKEIKKSWEDKEQGRAEKAKKSRQKFLLQSRQQNGESLNEEELNIINAPRVSRKQREEEAKQQILQKGKVTKKEDKKQVKGGKKEEVLDIVQVVQKEFPKSSDHTNTDIVAFLQHLEQDRLSVSYALHAGLISVRTDQQKKEIYEAVKMAENESVGIMTRNMSLREELRLYQKDQRDAFVNEYQLWRQQYKENWDQFTASREGLRQQMGVKIKKERDIIDICRQEKPSILPEDFEKLLQDAQETIPNINEELITVAQKVLKNIKINALSEKLTNAVQNYELDIIKSCLDLIEANFVEGIDLLTIEKAQDILEEAKSNPNWLAEKQAELKKQTKKGKK